MKANARSIALDALILIEQGGAYSNLTLQKMLNKHQHLERRDRSLVTELVYGTIQHQRLIDFQLQPYLQKPIAKLDHWVKQLLRLSMYQLVLLDRIPSHAVVHEAVEIAKRRGHRGISGMVNGVLRAYLRSTPPSMEIIEDPIERIGIEYSHPDWMIQRWVHQFGWDKTRQLCEENNRSPHVTLRVNKLKGSRQELKNKLLQDGFEVSETNCSSEGLQVIAGGNVVQTQWFEEGYFSIQDESSMLIAPLLDPQPGMRVLDACAAPGGKTTHLAEYMEDKGQIMAVDLHPHKEKLVQANAKRLGLTSIQTLVADARTLHDHIDQQFDRILLDAPCSGFGVIRRKPDLKWKKKETDIGQIAHIQYEILCSVAKLLKLGGHLVYSTCTIDKQENQQVINNFLNNHLEYRLIEGTSRQIFPQDFGSDGFYMTKIERIGDKHEGTINSANE